MDGGIADPAFSAKAGITSPASPDTSYLRRFQKPPRAPVRAKRVPVEKRPSPNGKQPFFCQNAVRKGGNVEGMNTGKKKQEELLTHASGLPDTRH
jgi:hypothetical protein